jgi:hypothetical protein
MTLFFFADSSILFDIHRLLIVLSIIGWYCADLSKNGGFSVGRIRLSCLGVRIKNFLFFSFFSAKRLRYFVDSAEFISHRWTRIKRKYSNAKGANEFDEMTG